MTFVDGSAPPACLGRDDSGHAPVVDSLAPILAERRGVTHAALAADRDLAGAGFMLLP